MLTQQWLGGFLADETLRESFLPFLLTEDSISVMRAFGPVFKLSFGKFLNIFFTCIETKQFNHFYET